MSNSAFGLVTKLGLATLTLATFGPPTSGGSIMSAGGPGVIESRVVQSTAVFPSSPELLLFGGENHKVFLGCLNCSENDGDSVFNTYGTHGAKYSTESIFNKYGTYGSKYSSRSACSPYASDPPIIVDRQGNSYGYLTLNKSAGQVRNPTVVAWLVGVCA